MEENLTDTTNRRVIVWDASAFIAGADPFSVSSEQFTVPLVKEEILKKSMVEVRTKLAIETEKLKVRTPKEKHIKRVKSTATSLGDSFYLSEADSQVLALALQLRGEGYLPLVATDDYSIQNVSDQLGIEFSSLATLGISSRLRWVRYCPACYKQYPADYKASKCKICGTRLKRKPSGKEALNQ